MLPDLSYEIAAGRTHGTLICGVDEVGRGPLAGPVTAAAVILPNCPSEQLLTSLADSKKLSAKKRAIAFDLIMAECDVSLAHCSVEEIDLLNILQASLRAMSKAILGLSARPAHALIDGNKLPVLPSDISAEAIIKGDSKSASIAAASIIAKETRDRLMSALAQEYPGYGWEKNAGYPTKAHREALLQIGITKHHRKSFKPVQEAQNKNRTSENRGDS